MASSLLLLMLSSLVVIGLSAKQQEAMTIETKFGVYDCIDFYKQPAFYHPLLMNHTSKASYFYESLI
ncbi:capsid protein [Bienertia sinuspersici]